MPRALLSLATSVSVVVLAATPAVATDAVPYAWGDGAAAPAKVRLPGEAGGQDVLAASAGPQQTCAVTMVGEVICWPAAEGDDAPTAQRVLGFGAAAGRPAASVAVGDRHACVTTDSGEVDCWGRNFHGQLGDGTTEDSEAPTRASGALIGRTATSAAAGGFHSCALTTDGDIWCWGRNTAGQLGDGTTTNSSTPVQVSRPAPDVAFTSVTAGFQHTCATASDGKAYCWGRNDHGQLGDGATLSASTPVAVAWPADAPALTSVSAGKWHTCGVAGDGRAWCWGRNDAGQLGNGTTDDSSLPVQVGGQVAAEPLVSVSAGTRHTCAAGQNSLAYCWGANGAGQLGDGTTTSSTTPVRASTAVSDKDFTPVTAVVAGSSASAALIAAGSRPGTPLDVALNGTTLTWSPPRIAGVGSGSLSQFRISYLAPGQAKPQVFATVPSSVTSIDLAAACPTDSVCSMKGGSLTPGAKYAFTVAGVSQTATSGASSPPVPATWPGPEVPAPVADALVPPDMPVVNGLFGTTLSWNPPFSAGGSAGVGQYSIRIRPFGATKFDEYAVVPASLTNLDLVGPCPAGGVCPKKGGDLQVGVTYEVWVYAIGSDGAQSKPPRGVAPFAFTWSG